MRFDTSLVIALLPSMCWAIAYGPGSKNKGGNAQSASLMASDDTDKLVNDHAGRPESGANDCGSSTFQEIPTDSPDEKPSVADCQELQKRTCGGEHEWVVPVSGREIVRYNTCGFFATAEGRPGVIGNGDICDLVQDSITKYGSKGYIHVKGGYKMYVVSSGGAMACDNPDHTKGVAVEVDWSISKTNRMD